MEDILSIYQLPYDPHVPVICMDEKPYQLLGEKTQSLPVRAGDSRTTDYEYIRNGTCSIFVFTEVLAGFRHVSVRERRTRQDWAEEIKYLLTELYPNQERIILVMDNLNTHRKASLYQAFPPQEAFELAKRLEIHYTPKHGSWLNIAEIELSVMERQCLGQRIDNLVELATELAAWESRRNIECKTVDWQLTTKDARTKLKSLYPKFKS